MRRITAASFATAVAAATAISAGQAPTATAVADTIRTVGCSQQALETAVDNGGVYRFDGSCSLDLTNDRRPTTGRATLRLRVKKR